MDLKRSRAAAPGLEWRSSVPSTNSSLVGRAHQLRDFTVLATDEQTHGKGRLDRTWTTAPGTALAVSVFIAHDPDGEWTPASTPDPERLGWLPLIAGLAMLRAVAPRVPKKVLLKWPNDLMVSGCKLAGILTELTPRGVVIGAGINLTTTHAQLPVETATSLTIEGATPDPQLLDGVLADYLTELRNLVDAWRGAPDLAAIHALVAPHVGTIGRAVRVTQPGRETVIGTATAIDLSGRLLVTPSDAAARPIAVSAGDVTHLRYE